VLAQFAGTSLWLTGNAILPELQQALHLSQHATGQLTSIVMLGFIAGTLSFAILSLPDRFSPAHLFFTCSLLGALFNYSIVWIGGDATTLFILRFFTGYCIAGIYPVGMKIAADWYEKGLGKALGFLLGALVIGTAFPHLLKNRDFELPWKSVLWYTSLFAVFGGTLMLLFVGDGPFRKKSGRLELNAIATIFHSRPWRRSAFGYFGHMWELYTFWGFLPLLISLYSAHHQLHWNVPLLSFLVIASGSISCIAGGYWAAKAGSARVATTALMVSGACCLLSPLSLSLPAGLFLLLLFTWGLAVIPDSPQYSTLATQYAPPHLRGTALTIYNSIGFMISTVSLLVIDYIMHSNSFWAGKNTYALLSLGALAGLPSMFKLVRSGG
jgi:MFS family permease